MVIDEIIKQEDTYSSNKFVEVSVLNIPYSFLNTVAKLSITDKESLPLHGTKINFWQTIYFCPVNKTSAYWPRTTDFNKIISRELIGSKEIASC